MNDQKDSVYKAIQDVACGKQSILQTFGFYAPKSSILPTGNDLGEEGINMPVTIKDIDSQIGQPGGARFVKLEAGRPKTLGISDANLTTMTVTDKETGVEKIVNAIVLKITSEDGTPCSKEMTLSSKKLINAIKNDLARELYKNKKLKVNKIGERFNVEYEYSWI